MSKREKADSAAEARFEGLPGALLDWYGRHARSLPWRIGPGKRAEGVVPDPYRVWLAEIMLQQTTVPHAAGYFETFTRTWPTVEALAGAEDSDVMAAWAGLGYYARARNLLKCAREVTARGRWPRTEAGLRELPGIGPYTAGAVAALAFGEPSAAVDGNVDRVFSRLMATKGDWKEEKRRIAETVKAIVPSDRPGEFAEALMDLGATVCTPKRPNCLICPLRDWCAAYAEGAPDRYPIKPAKKAKPVRYGEVYVVRSPSGVAVETRPPHGLLGGMLGLPTTDWLEDSRPERATWMRGGSEIGEVKHVFTHFELRLLVVTSGDAAALPQGYGFKDEETVVAALPSAFRKALKLAS